MIDREQFDDLLSVQMARYDEALAGETLSPGWDESAIELDPELATEWEQAKSCLELLDRARRGGLSIAGERSAGGTFPGVEATAAPRKLGRFRIERELGRGGLGIVYLAHDPQLSRKVALKIPRVDVVAHGDSQRRFLREAEAASRLSHPNIVSLYEVGEDGTTCYLACEYCTGPTLSQWLRRRSEPVDARQAATIVLRLAEAVEHAHSRGVLHRDIKPGNVMLSGADDAGPDRDDADREAFIPKLIDFGLAKLTEQAGGETRTGAVLGTLAYMSPEQAEGRLAELDSRTDVYALGAILYELLTGSAPYLGKGDADTLRQLLLGELAAPRRARPDLPRDLEAITLKCLAARPANRYATAHEVALDLARFLAGEPTVARPIAAWERVFKWTRRRPAIAALVAVSTIAAISLLGVGAIYSARLEVAHGRSRQLLYAADMKTGFNGYSAGHLPTVEERLSNYRAASGGEDLQTFTWRLLESLSHPDLRTLYGHSAAAVSLAWRGDGQLVASGGRDYLVRLWDVRQSRALPPLAGHTEDVNALAFSPDGRLLASASDDYTVRIWTLDGSSPVRILSDFSNLAVYGVAFSPDGLRLVTVGEDALVRVWNTADWSLEHTWSHHKSRVNCVAFCADGSRLATGSHDGTAQVLRFPSGQILSVCDVAREPGHSVDCLAISPDGSTLATSCIAGRSFGLWSTDTGRANSTSTRQDNTIYSLSFSADGRLVAGAMRSGAIRIWDAVNRDMRHMLLAHEAAARGVRFSPSGHELISCGLDGLVKHLKVEPSDRRESQRTTFNAVRTIAFQPGGQAFAYVEADGELVLVDTRSGRPDLRMRTAAPGPTCPIKFSSDGRLLAFLAHEGRELRIMDMATREIRTRLQFDQAPILAVSFVAHDRQLIISEAGGALSVWDVQSGRRLQQVQTDQREIYSVLPLPKKGLVATIDPNGAWLRDADSLEPREELPRFLDKLNGGAASSPDESTIVAGTTTGKTVVWKLESGGARTDLVGHDGKVLAVAYCPLGDTFVSCDSAGAILLWDHRTLQQVGELSVSGAVSNDITFSPNGTTLATGGSHADYGMLQFWSINSAQQGPTCNDHNQVLYEYDVVADDVRDKCYEAVDHFLIDGSDASQATVVLGANSLARFNLTSTIGGQHQGRLKLEQATRVEANDELFVGRHAGSQGELLLAENSQWHSNGYITIGDAGHGELTAMAGTSIRSARVLIGQETGADGFVSLSGPGTTWTTDTNWLIAGLGRGRVRLKDGARLFVDLDITIGHREDSAGGLAASGAGTELRTRAVTIGDRGVATMSVDCGALVDCQEMVLASRSGSGQLTIADEGSRVTCQDAMYLAGGGSRGSGSNASVEVSAGATLEVHNRLKIWDRGVLCVDGGAVDAATLELDPGAILNWRGGEIACRGVATLHGRLDLTGNPAIVGAVGQRLSVMTYDSQLGKLRIIGAPPGIDLELEYGEKQLWLKVSKKPAP